MRLQRHFRLWCKVAKLKLWEGAKSSAKIMHILSYNHAIINFNMSGYRGSVLPHSEQSNLANFVRPIPYKTNILDARLFRRWTLCSKGWILRDTIIISIISIKYLMLTVHENAYYEKETAETKYVITYLYVLWKWQIQQQIEFGIRI